MHPFLVDQIRRIVFQRSAVKRPCAHPAPAMAAAPASATCLPCVERGEPWLKLRMCLTCGTAGCCDSSTGRHARAHFDATGHPLMRSIEPGETWAWCYPDEAYLATEERASARSR